MVGIMLIHPNFWQSFWPSFWANFLSTFIVGVIVTGLISWVIKKSKKVEAKIFVEIFRETDTTIRLTFFLQNTGKVSFKADEIVWNVFIEQPLLATSQFTAQMIKVNPELELVRENLKLAGTNHVLYNDLFNKPLFPGRRAALFSIEATPTSKNFGLYYFLS